MIKNYVDILYKVMVSCRIKYLIAYESVMEIESIAST